MFEITIPSSFLLEASQIFETNIKVVSFIKMDKGCCVFAHTNDSFYIRTWEEKIPQNFSMNLEEYLDFLEKKSSYRYNVDFENHEVWYKPDGNETAPILPLSNLYWWNAPEYSGSLRLFQKITKEISISNGKFNRKNSVLSETESELKDPFHLKMGIDKWMVGTFWKIYASHTHPIYFFFSTDSHVIRGKMAWTWENPDEEVTAFSWKKNLRNLQVKTVDDVYKELLVDNHHGIYMINVLAENYPQILKQFVGEEDLPIFYKEELTTNEREVLNDYWMDITGGAFLSDKGEKYFMWFGPCGDLFAVNSEEFDLLSEEEQEKLYVY